jgi:hypothetical protein
VATVIPDPDDVLMVTNDVTLYFQGTKLLSVFDDIVELRNTSCAGALVTTTQTGTNGQLDVLPGSTWCVPAVIPQITTYRPLNYIAVKYTDCASPNRQYATRLMWKLTLPNWPNTYQVCYFNNGSWSNIGTLSVVNWQQNDQALRNLYLSAGGTGWYHRTGWANFNTFSACLMHGVKCDAQGKIIGRSHRGCSWVCTTEP